MQFQGGNKFLRRFRIQWRAFGGFCLVGGRRWQFALLELAWPLFLANEIGDAGIELHDDAVIAGAIENKETFLQPFPDRPAFGTLESFAGPFDGFDAHRRESQFSSAQMVE